MTTPALQRLRERAPEARITLLTPEKLADLWQQHPSINAVITFASGENPWSIARRLRPQHFDTALILPNSPRSALEVWLAGIPRRIGYALPWRNWFLTQTIPTPPGHVQMRKRSAAQINRLIQPQPDRPPTPASATHQASRITHPPASHQVHHYVHLAAALGADPQPVAPLLALSPGEVEAVASKFGLSGSAPATPNAPIFGLNPGAEYGPAKRWPLDQFIIAAREIQKRTRCTWLILGAQSDLPAADALHSALRTPDSAPRNLAGQTTLRELMALLKLCRVLLTNDTGPMHLAAALGTPVVVPFGSTSPDLTGPGLPGDPRHRLLTSDAPCAPCFRRACPIDFRCMTGISAERVIQAVLAAVS